MVNDFEDFAQKFRARAAARLTEFEQVLEKTQRNLEKGAQQAVRAHEQQLGNASARESAVQARPVSAAQHKKPGQVKSVLRKG